MYRFENDLEKSALLTNALYISYKLLPLAE